MFPGQCLNFNCTWVLVLMLRRCITALRERGFGSVLPLDYHIYLHKLTGVLIVVLSIWHTAMHLCNFSKWLSTYVSSIGICSFLIFQVNVIPV